ncbi:heterokaryon incompatibility protein-domain-containing protein [Triangularia setosa]|uniref:Heterokaryon incompatibility protein-domain-containing protein n=1 Tax=Triangularia setosa TaxID=2587417 RepID=A0AAN7ABW7_9PEZI|nr:heterokaryon incompatibility protein-domain-containing protein [Podospora setosa]
MDCDAPPGLPSKLPTRLPKVTGEKIRLVDTRDIALSEGRPLRSYLTLSHCWGSSPHTQIKATSTNNIWVLRRVTRELEFGYIWIDSLCIMQDDRHDWDRELSMMASIYRNSFFDFIGDTIRRWPRRLLLHRFMTPYTFGLAGKATSSHTNGSGILKKIEAGSFQRWFALTPPDDIRDIPLRDISSPNVEVKLSYPLLARASVSQGRLLSPRVVHFGSTQPAWECRCSFWTDDYIMEDAPTSGKMACQHTSPGVKVCSGSTGYRAHQEACTRDCLM